MIRSFSKSLFAYVPPRLLLRWHTGEFFIRFELCKSNNCKNEYEKTRATKKGIFCVTLDSKILMYDSTLRFSHLRKP